MIKDIKRKEKRKIRHSRIREKIKGNTEKPRVSYYRSLKHIYIQAIDDTKGETLLSLSTLSKDIKNLIEGKSQKEIHSILGQKFAELLLDKGIKKIVFDRGGYLYHGNLKLLCEEMRKMGIEF
ncbi:MAG TPA: 50S ribosomal protein L18 [Caldisericia bacterium]|jgi:large subunit ribosomal protein L18|nr:50S ribosomal protein L18 [Caldisericia bacterium]NLI56249.1 50S ribosomal protein L18 [bacterium]HOC52713.1 50S ribosomal protein L18 [Caldisericia bacterium]HQJ56056.1 50S ribosomal protein L18 [Caldisericia bacterium]HQL66600.1 50S ribosomal protein L18 [Caldisericia bacterium]